MALNLLAHLSLWDHWSAYSIGRPLSSVCMCVCVLSTFSNILKPDFVRNLLGTGKRKFVQTVLVMTRMAAMPIYGKNLKKFLLPNQKADDLETWYAALSARVLSSLFT